MKKSLAYHLCLSAAVLGLSALQAFAGYVVPNVAPSISAAKPHHQPPPPSIPGVQWVTNPLNDGPGSLRAAISNAASGDKILFRLRLPATIILRSTLVIDKDLNILGPDPEKLVVARTFSHHAPSFRVFQVDSGIVTIAGLSIVNGRARNSDGVSDNLGGGILNEGSLTVSNCCLVANAALAENGGNGFGGGIFTLGPLKVINSSIRGNRANFAGGGVCTFKSSNVQIEATTISGNFAGVQGGGVNFQGLAASFKNCTISGNKTPEDGTASALLNLVFPTEASALDLTACTITENRGNTNGAVVFAALSGNLGNTNRMINTLVANNRARNFTLDGNPVLQSHGHNLDSDGTSGLVNGNNGDIVGTLATPVQARLGYLRDNGGPTRTHALLAGSPALNTGTCLDLGGNALAADQRGVSRPQGPACDIGAFEKQTFKITKLKADPNVLWPPNGKLVPVRISVWTTEGCGALGCTDGCKIISVQSNEPVGSEPDWKITGDLSLLLRAERAGSANGRIYKITVECKDGNGSTEQGIVEVRVPHSIGHLIRSNH